MTQMTAVTSVRARVARSHSLTSPLHRVRWFGYVVLGMQLVGFLIWSTIQYSRFALTFDFAIYNQAWFLIAHGNLLPYDTIQNFLFWHNHGELLWYPLALLYWLWPHAVTLLWLQDLCIVGAEAVAFSWLCEIARRYRPDKDAAWLAGAGLVLFIANPWMWWAISFDFHMEPFATLMVLLSARDLANGRRRAWVWVAPLLACGDVAGTYLAGLGLGGVVSGRRSRLPGAVMACIGVCATMFIALIHGNLGSAAGLRAYSYLATGRSNVRLSLTALAMGIISHPLVPLRVLWAKHLDMWANLAPIGLVGLCEPLLLPLVLVVLLANNLFQGFLFAEPTFQYLPIYIFVPIGTVAILGRLMQRRRRLALLLIGLVVAQALGWAMAWTPRAPQQLIRVSALAAATLRAIEARVPGSAAVIASQGVMGEFAQREDIRPLDSTGMVPVRGGETWLIVAPAQGIEIQTAASAMALIGELAGPLHATLVVHGGGVWAFRWHPPPGVHSVTMPGALAPLPAWAAPLAPGSAGLPVTSGPERTWHMTSVGKAGYVDDGLTWQAHSGRYQAHVTLSATGRVNVEVWNDNGNMLLARRSIPTTNGIETVVLPVNATTSYPEFLYSGWGPFRADFLTPIPGQRLEVRVWSAGTGTVNVYRAALTAEKHGASRPPNRGHKRKD